MPAYDSSEQLFRWCKILPEALPDHPEAKVKLKILPTAAAIYEDLANTMVDEFGVTMIAESYALDSPLRTARTISCFHGKDQSRTN